MCTSWCGPGERTGGAHWGGAHWGANLHIVMLRSDVAILKRSDDDWRAAQGLFADYMSSVGAHTLAEALEWIELERPDLNAARSADIAAFAAGSGEILQLT
jgi:hypothetical protein